ncbi:MAG: hypothetical protein KDA60_13840 [Planctomycetales bacterium]|nr:hypothetical protein [Planctomycetales bacterium]
MFSAKSSQLFLDDDHRREHLQRARALTAITLQAATMKRHDLIARYFRQGHHALRATPRVAQVAGILLIALGLCTWAFRGMSPTGSRYELLLDGRHFSRAERVEMEAAFSKQSLTDYTFVDGCCQVPREQRNRYVAALVDGQAMPTDFSDPTLLDVGSPFETEAQKRQRRQSVKERALASTIRSINGIDEASVMYDEKRVHSLRNDTEATAMVAIRTTVNRPISARRLDSICQMVAAAFESLSPSQVTIMDLSTGLAIAGDSPTVKVGVRGEEFALIKAMYEEQFTSKITRVLDMIPDVQVACEVELTEQKVSGEETPDKFGGHGQLVEDPRVGLHQPWVPHRVSVTVRVPKDYFAAVWRQRQEATELEVVHPTTADLAQIEEDTRAFVRDVVAGLAPVSAELRLASQIQVVTFDRMAPVTTLARRSNWQWRKGQLWPLVLGAASLLITLLIAGVCRDVYRWLQQRKGKSGTLRVVSAGDVPEGNSRSDRDALRDVAHEEIAGTVGSEDVQSRLTELVRDDPQTAVSMLKTWVSKAG